MLPARPLVLASVVCLTLTGAALAAGITGAGSGSTGGTITGTTNESSPGMKTGAANGGETVPSMQGRSGVGTGDNAVLNAPGETKPGTLPPSQPSNLNGQNPQP